MARVRQVLAALGCAAGIAAAPAGAAPSLPAGFELQTLVDGLNAPTAMAFAPDGRIFIAQKDGTLKAWKGGVTSTVVDLSARINSFWDRGMLGVAVDRDFAANGYVYLLYTVENDPLVPDNSGPTVSRLVRIAVTPDNAVVNPASPETVLVGTSASNPCPQPHQSTVDCIPADHYWHNIGTVRVDPADGSLWFGSGDASNQASPYLTFRAYDENTYAGKLSHVDRDGRGLPGHPFCPTDSNLTDVCTKLYAKGLRNPFRFTLRDAGKGPVVGDVGWAEREEIDLARPGRDYGWPCYEGDVRPAYFSSHAACTQEYAREGTASAATPPELAYAHAGSDAAIVGGPLYTRAAYPAAYRGQVFYADYARGWVRRATVTADDSIEDDQQFASGLGAPVDIQVAPDGSLAYVDIGDFSPGSGALRKIVFTPGNRSPAPVATADVSSGALPLAVTFDGRESTDPDGDALTYDWDFGDGAAHSSAARPTHVYATAGEYTVRLTVDDGAGHSASTPLAIVAGTPPEIVAVTAPATSRDGDPVVLSATATNADGQSLPGSAFTWQVILHHAQHLHQLGNLTGATTSFVAPADHDADSHYEVRLRVSGQDGLTATRTLTIQPATIQLTLTSSPPGAAVGYDAHSGSTPLLRTAAVGYGPLVSAAPSFQLGGDTYVFERWSDRGARIHQIAVPVADATYTASYARVGGDSINAVVPTGTAESPPAAPEEPPLIDLKLARSGLRASPDGDVRIKLLNRNAETSSGVVRIVTTRRLRRGRAKPKRLELGRAAFAVRGRKSRKVTAKLSKADLELLAKLRRIDVEVSFEARGRDGRADAGGASSVLLAPRLAQLHP